MSNERMTGDPHDPGMTAAFVEGRLDAREAALVTAHAAECASCREVLAALARGAGPELPHVSHGRSEPDRVPRHPARALLPLAATLTLAVLTGAVALRLIAPPQGPPAAPPEDARPAPAAGAPSPPAMAPPEPGPIPGDAAVQPLPPEPADERLLPRRGGERRIAGKVFRLTAGEWVDDTYDPVDGLPTVEVPSAVERGALLAREPALRPFAALGDRVTVVHGGVVYHFR